MTKTYRMTNKEVVDELREVLAAMEVKDLNKFKIRAYQNAIASIDNLTSSVYDLWENNRLSEIPGVGGGLSQHLDDLFNKGKVKDFFDVKKDLPAGMFELIGLRGVGAKTAYKLATAFNLSDRNSALKKVKKAAEGGKIRVLDGFGEKSEKDILDAISEEKKTKNVKQRMLLIQAEEISERVLKYMEKLDCIDEIDVLGSLRRRAPTVGDIDLAVATNDPGKVIEHFVKFGEVDDVLSKGDKKASVVFKNDVQVDLMVCEPKAYGSLLQHFTGSKQHNVELRKYSLGMGMSLSEQGIKTKNGLEKIQTETEFYKKLKMDYIPPEIRSGTSEIKAAVKGKLPNLVELKDIKGDLHTHTVASDGVDKIEDVVIAAKDIGYEYLGISDHAPSVQSRGRYDVLGIVEAKRREIEHINDSVKGIRVLFGYEVNILKDASLSMPDDIMNQLDYVIGSIHTSFDQDREISTKRLINAIENPNIDIIGHPSGRLINQRDACDIEWKAVFDAAMANNKILEINAQPSRLDLADDLIPEALDKGVKLIINTDAHAIEDLYLMKYGIDTARRGGCEAENIVNTYSLGNFLKTLKIK